MEPNNAPSRIIWTFEDETVIIKSITNRLSTDKIFWLLISAWIVMGNLIIGYFIFIWFYFHHIGMIIICLVSFVPLFCCIFRLQKCSTMTYTFIIIINHSIMPPWPSNRLTPIRGKIEDERTLSCLYQMGNHQLNQMTLYTDIDHPILHFQLINKSHFSHSEGE